MLRRVLPMAALAVAGLVTLTACDSARVAVDQAKNDPSVPADQVIGLVKKTVDTATAVHLKGSIKDGGDTVAMDLQLNTKDNSASGTIGMNGQTFPIIETSDKVVYIQFNKDLIKVAEGDTPNPQVEALLLNKWVPSTSKLFAGQQDQFKQILDLKQILNGFDNAPNGLVDPTGSATVNNEPADVYKDADGAKAFLAKAAPHYLLRIDFGPKDGPGVLDFTGWNKPVPVTAPPADQIYSGPGS